MKDVSRPKAVDSLNANQIELAKHGMTFNERVARIELPKLDFNNQEQNKAIRDAFEARILSSPKRWDGSGIKKVGDFRGVPVYEDPNCPPGKVYFLNDNYAAVPYAIDTRSRWQHFIDWLKGIFKR
jgi:hypothetical protein